MRIGIIAREFPPSIGGMEIVAEHVVRELAQSDELVVFTRRGKGLRDVRIDQRPLLTGDLGDELTCFREEDIDVWLALNAGYAMIAGHLARPLWIYAHGNDFLRLGIDYRRWWDEALHRMPYFWRHRKTFKMLSRPLRRRNMLEGLSHVAGIFANSSNTARLFFKHYGYRPVVACPGVDDQFFDVEDRNGIGAGSGQIRLLTVSRLRKRNRRKNVDGVLRAIALLKDRDLEYTVVGDGDDLPRLKALATALGISRMVRFTGRVTDEQLRNEFARANLFVLASKASRHDIEGFGIVYLEACATGTPALCSREGGSTDAVVDGESGIIVERSDPESIALGIQRFIEMREQLTPSKVRAFAEGFRWPAVVERIRSHLVQTLNAPARSIL